MIQEHVTGVITDIDQWGNATIVAPIPNLGRAVRRRYDKVEVILPDGRGITPLQRRKIYALIGEVAEYIEGVRIDTTIESTKKLLKAEFMLHRMEGMERRLFSLADCDETTAREFISFIIDFIIENDIPTQVPLIAQAEDVERYVYSCLAAKKCAVCGQEAELHHVDTIGMGGDRREVHHLGRRCLPLCRKHHTELHQLGHDFVEHYHLTPVKIDKRLCKLYKLKK